MKTIYVLKDNFRGFRRITEEEANQGIKDGLYFGVELKNDEIKIILLESPLFMLYGYSDQKAEALIKEYFDYVESITGMAVVQYEKV